MPAVQHGGRQRKGIATSATALPDFLRLAGDAPYVMENVVPRLINAPWSEKLCAADFGDVTSRKRWFYSNYLLHVIPTPGPRRIRDIRDRAEDERVLKKRESADETTIRPHARSIGTYENAAERRRPAPVRFAKPGTTRITTPSTPSTPSPRTHGTVTIYGAAGS